MVEQHKQALRLRLPDYLDTFANILILQLHCMMLHTKCPSKYDKCSCRWLIHDWFTWTTQHRTWLIDFFKTNFVKVLEEARAPWWANLFREHKFITGLNWCQLLLCIDATILAYFALITGDHFWKPNLITAKKLFVWLCKVAAFKKKQRPTVLK